MSQEPNTNAVIGTEIGKSANTSPIKWWQWILYYPQLPVALVGVIAAFVGSLGGLSPVLIRWLDRPTQEEQNRLWNDNAPCLQGTDVDRATLRARSLYDVDISACEKTGDVLLQIHPPGDADPTHGVSYWISTKPIYMNAMLAKEAAYSFIGPVQAQEASGPRPTRIIATKIEGHTVVQRQQLSDNTCIDLTIDANTGRHLRSQSAPCVPF